MVPPYLLPILLFLGSDLDHVVSHDPATHLCREGGEPRQYPLEGKRDAIHACIKEATVKRHSCPAKTEKRVSYDPQDGTFGVWCADDRGRRQGLEVSWAVDHQRRWEFEWKDDHNLVRRWWKDGHLTAIDCFDEHRNEVLCPCPKGTEKVSDGDLSTEWCADRRGRRTGPIVTWSAGKGDAKFIAESGYYLNDKRDGLWTSYTFLEGRLTSAGHYRAGKKEGLWRTFHEDGSVEWEATYSRGRFEGVMRKWHANGQLAKERSHRRGKIVGTVRTWHENGQLASEVMVRKGRAHGQRRYYDEDGVLIRTECWVGGRQAPCKLEP